MTLKTQLSPRKEVGTGKFTLKFVFERTIEVAGDTEVILQLSWTVKFAALIFEESLTPTLFPALTDFSLAGWVNVTVP